MPPSTDPAATVVRLALPPGGAALMRAAAHEAYPAEACGFLIGRPEGDELRVERVARAENRAARPDRFYIDAADVFRAMRAARRRGDELLGVWHSHPDAAAAPSATDRAEAWGELAHVIVSCRGGEAAEVAAWRLDGAEFRRLPIRERDR